MEFNVDPYHDDFEQNAKDNNYVKILFKPGYSVQARELTQIQSILQNQIKSFGDHIFQDGSPVIGGNLTLDNKISYIKLDETYNNEDIEIDQFLNRIIIRESDGAVQAKVLATYYPSGGVPTLMIKYISGSEFLDADILKIAGTSTRAKCVDSNATGRGTVVSINEGIFYVNGYFVNVNQQTATVAAYSQNANVKIGLEISDEVVDYVVDSTLLDPAQSSFNYQAPGADRYQFNLNLSTRPLETAIDESSFFELMRVENGTITKQVKYPIYSEIEKTLARRTFDESGDYTINPFIATTSPSTDDNKYIISLSPGKAYVKGFEFETIGTFKMEVDKPRTVGIDTRNLVDIDVDTSYGNYLKFKNVRGSANSNSFLDIINLESVDLHCVPANSVNIGLTGGATANVFHYANTKIGTAKVRNIQRDSSAGESTFDSNGVYRFYFTEINIKPLIIRTSAAGDNASSITLPSYASPITNAYQNVSITVLPIALTPVANVNTANVFINSTRVNANSLVASVFSSPNVEIGDIIRIGSDVRKVVSVNSTGDYLIVNTAFSANLVGSSATTNPLEIFRQTDYSSNVTGQTRIINSYNGTTYKAVLDRAFDDSVIAAQNTVIQLNFGIKDLESIMEANPSVPVANAHANVSIQSKLINGDVEMFEPSKGKLLYRLPRDYVKYGSLNNVDYNHTKYIQKSGVSGVFIVNSGNGLDASETLPWSITNANIQDNLIAVIRNGSGNHATYPNGSILQLSTSQVTACSGGIKITTDSTVSALDVYINIKQNNTEVSSIRNKTLRRNQNYTTAPFNYPTSTGVSADYTVTLPNKGTVAKINIGNGLIFVTDPTYSAVGPGDSFSLFVPDMIKLRKVLMGNTTSSADATNYEDITDRFSIDLGARDEIYDHAKLILKQGYSVPTGQLTIHADFFTHTYPAGASYFSVDSYESTLYSNGEIPVYISDTGTYYLRDCLDFRPTRQIGAVDGTLQVGRLTSPDSSTELSYDYYLPRIDKLVLSKNKEFRIIQGTSSANPVPPADSDDAMTLYNIYLPPYVANVKDIRTKYIENRRYTMKDISSIDKRVKAIEYYTSLNNIESTALNDPTTYEDGTDKAKYGIIGEGFRNYNIADYKNPDFTASMEKDTLTAAQTSKTEGLSVIGFEGTTDNEKTVTLSYTETPAIVQDVTSNKTLSVQPFLFAQFIGHVTLTPEIDYWVSEILKPEVVRGPEVTQIETVKETTIKEVIREKIVEPTPLPTTPAPSSNAKSVIILTPGDDVVIPNEVLPEIFEPPIIPICVLPQPYTPPEVVVTPIEYPPQPPSVWEWTWNPSFPVAFSGQAIDFINGYASTSYPSSFDALNWGIPAYTQIWPSIDLLAPVYAAGVNYASTPLPETSLPIYDNSVTATSSGSSTTDYTYDWSDWSNMYW